LAEFNPKTRVDTGQDYNFKGQESNKSLGTLLSGVANTADDFIGAIHRADVQNIGLEARQGEESIQDNLFKTEKVAAAQASTTAGGQALPEDLTRGFQHAMDLKSAREKGQMRESDYLANIDVLAKKMRSRLGNQYADEIDSALGNAMSNTANAFRKQLFNEIDANTTAVTDELKEKRKLVDGNLQYFYTPSHQKILGDIDNTPVSQIRHIIAEGEFRKANASLLNAESQLAKDTENSTKEQKTALFRKQANLSLATLHNEAGESIVPMILNRIGKITGVDSEQGEFVSKDEQQELLTAAAQFRLYGEQEIQRLWAEAGDDVDPKELEIMQKNWDRNVALTQDLIENKQIGLLAYNAMTEGGKIADAARTFLGENPGFAKTTAMISILKEKGVDGYFNSVIQEEVAKHGRIQDSKGMELVGQVLQNRPGVITQASEALRIAFDSGDAKALLKAQKGLIGALNDDRTPPDTAVDIINNLFDPRYPNFIGSFSSSNGQWDAQGNYSRFSNAEDIYYNQVMTPQTIQTALALKDNDRNTWSNFKNWAVNTSMEAILGDVLNQQIEDGAKAKFDVQLNQFINPTKKPKEGRALSGWTEKQHAIDRVNTWINRITPVLKADGLDPSAELRRIFTDRGFRASTVSSWLSLALPEEETDDGGTKE
jgi:hypothetical protein